MEDAIIISDIHLGSDVCQAKLLENFLEDIELRTKTLILNGDVFDSLNFERLKKSHWKILSKIRKISDKINVVWLTGNHDGPVEIFSHLIGVTTLKEYIFISGNTRILLVHGDIFDNFINENPILTWIGDWIYFILQKIDRKHEIARWAKQQSKHYLRCREKIRHGAIQHMEEFNCSKVCCGHSHCAETDGVYYNSGCWTELPCTYLTINNGEIKICAFDKVNS